MAPLERGNMAPVLHSPGAGGQSPECLSKLGQADDKFMASTGSWHPADGFLSVIIRVCNSTGIWRKHLQLQVTSLVLKVQDSGWHGGGRAGEEGGNRAWVLARNASSACVDPV